MGDFFVTFVLGVYTEPFGNPQGELSECVVK